MTKTMDDLEAVRAGTTALTGFSPDERSELFDGLRGTDQTHQDRQNGQQETQNQFRLKGESRPSSK